MVVVVVVVAVVIVVVAVAAALAVVFVDKYPSQVLYAYGPWKTTCVSVASRYYSLSHCTSITTPDLHENNTPHLHKHSVPVQSTDIHTVCKSVVQSCSNGCDLVAKQLHRRAPQTCLSSTVSDITDSGYAAGPQSGRV